MNVAEIRAALDERGIDYPKGAKKAELEQLLESATGDDGASGVAPSSSAAKHAAVQVARIDAKIERLKVRREHLTRLQTRERSTRR